MSELKNTLSKDERLYMQKRIDALFTSGESFIAYPLRVVYMMREKDETPASMMVSVSKKKFKRAVKRNRVKRLVREAFRLNKGLFHALADENNKSFDIAFLYLKNVLPNYEEMEKAIVKTSVTLRERLTVTDALIKKEEI